MHLTGEPTGGPAGRYNIKVAEKHAIKQENKFFSGQLLSHFLQCFPGMFQEKEGNSNKKEEKEKFLVAGSNGKKGHKSETSLCE